MNEQQKQREVAIEYGNIFIEKIIVLTAQHYFLAEIIEYLSFCSFW